MNTPLSINQGYLKSEPEGEIWVRTGDKVGTLADNVCGELLDGRLYVDLASIGAGALNQSVKSVAEVRQRLHDIGLDIHMIPYFSVIRDAENQERTRLILRVFLVEQPDDEADY